MNRMRSLIGAMWLVSMMLLGAMQASAEPLPPGADVEVGFSPDAGALDLVIRGIGSARSSLNVAAYSFSSRPIAEALVSAHRRGVKVAVVADSQQNKKGYTAVRYLFNNGIPVRTVDRLDAMHSKFIVIDGQHLETGSFNYSSAAAHRNAENVILLWNVPLVAQKYEAEWSRLWSVGTDMSRSN